MKRWRLAFLQALGGKCVHCGCSDLNKLEIHCTTDAQRGYENKQRLGDIRDYRLTGRIPVGRFLLCARCHALEHGSAYTKVKAQIEDELKKLQCENRT